MASTWTWVGVTVLVLLVLIIVAAMLAKKKPEPAPAPAPAPAPVSPKLAPSQKPAAPPAPPSAPSQPPMPPMPQCSIGTVLQMTYGTNAAAPPTAACVPLSAVTLLGAPNTLVAAIPSGSAPMPLACTATNAWTILDAQTMEPSCVSADPTNLMVANSPGGVTPALYLLASRSGTPVHYEAMVPSA